MGFCSYGEALYSSRVYKYNQCAHFLLEMEELPSNILGLFLVYLALTFPTCDHSVVCCHEVVPTGQYSEKENVPQNIIINFSFFTTALVFSDNLSHSYK